MKEKASPMKVWSGDSQPFYGRGLEAAEGDAEVWHCDYCFSLSLSLSPLELCMYMCCRYL